MTATRYIGAAVAIAIALPGSAALAQIAPRPITRGHLPATAGSTGSTGSAGSAVATEPSPDPTPAAPAPELPWTCVAPRLASLALGATSVGRSFKYDAHLQRESTLARPGVVVQVEAFPLLALGGLARGLGLAASYAKELGKANLQQAANATLSLPVNQDRWTAALRYAFVPSPRVVVVPSLGLAGSRFAVRDATETLPSLCTSTSTDICLAAVRLLAVTAGSALRLGLSPNLALTANATVLASLSLGAAPGELAAESRARSFGVSADLGLAFTFVRALAITTAVGVTTFQHSFHGGQDLGYSSASETYYGITVGVVFSAP